MKRLSSFLFCTILIIPFLKAQTTAPDTSEYPYWVDMMQDPTVNFYKTQRAFNLYWENRTIEKGSGYKPFKRWEYNMSQLIDGKGNIPAPGSLEAEVEKYLKLRAAPTGFGGGFSMGGAIGSGTATCQVSGNWKEIGPDYQPKNRTGQPNGLGRINGLAFHPTDTNVIYAGAPAGGVWVTTDGGKTWSTNTDTLATLGVSSIAIDPQRPDTIYLGTGDRDASDSYGRGVFKSIDAGKTWQQSTSGMGNTVVGKIVIDPKNTDILLAATSSGVFRSTNAGQTWSRSVSGNFKDLTFDAVNSKYAYACRTGAQFYRSADNGQTWTKITSGLSTGKSRAAVAVTPADSNFVYVVITNQRTFEGLYLSTNRGVSFTRMSNTPNIMDYSHLGSGTGGQAWYDLDISADPNDKSIVNVCGVNIFQSLDSGATWKINAHWVGSGGAPSVHADNHVLEYQPKTDALFSGNDGGVYYTKDRGSSWTDISKGLGIAQIYRLGQSATQRDYLINGYQDNGTGLLEKGSWYTVVGGDGMDCVIDPTDENYAYSDLYYGDVRRMVNGYSTGTIAKDGKNGITESGGWVTPFVLREGTPSTMFVGYKNIWRSTNIKAASVNSVTWTKISNNVAGSNSQNIRALENSAANSDILYVSRSGNKFFKSTNVNAASPSWTDLTSNLPNASSVLWIESHPKKAYRVWICQSNKVYQSDNGGSSWTNISNGLPNIPMLSLVFDSSSKNQGMYVGTYMGVFYKDTTMSSWIWYNDNMPINTRVRDVEIYYSPQGRDKSHVVCATYGRGNWRSPLYDEEQEVPEPGFTSETVRVCQGQAVQFTDTSAKLPTNWYWKFTPNTVSFLNGTDSCSQNPSVSFNATGTYTVKLYAENCIGHDSVEMTDYIEVFQPITSAKCTPKTERNTSGLGIFEVKIDQYTFPSSDKRSEGEYLDMACTNVLNLKSDTGYVAEILTGTRYKEYVKIYIDFNNNGDLEDAGELVYDTYETRNHKDTIKIPITAVSNTLIRMRVMSDYNVIDHSCDTLRYGQTEDYGIVLEPRIPIPHFTIDTNRICQNSTITLTDSSIGNVYKKRWYVSKYGLLTFKSDLDGPIGFNLPDTGWYYAELVLNDSIVSKRIDSIVYVAPYPSSALAITSGSANACEGESIVFKNTTDYKTGTFAWYKNGVAMVGLDDSVITLGNVALQDSGNYHSTIEFGGCESVSNVIRVDVNPMPNADFSIANMDTCLNTNGFDFTDNSTIKSGTMSYDWDFGQGGTASIASPSKTYTDTGRYTVRLALNTPAGCKDTASKDVRVWSSPTADFTVNASPQCLTGNNFILTNSSSINAGGMTYNWDLGDGSNSTGVNVSYSYGSVNTFDVQLITISDKNCRDTVTNQVITSPSPVADFNIVLKDSCLANNEIDFVNQSTVSSGTITLNDWDFGNGTTGVSQDSLAFAYGITGVFNVELIVESDAGCRDTIQKTTTVHPSPTADFTLDNDIQCFNGHSFTLNNTSSGGSNNTFNWAFGDGTSSSNQNPPPLTYTAPGTYTIELTMTTDQQCQASLSVDATVNPNPVVSFTGGIGCIGETIDFINASTISSGTIAGTQWWFGDGNTSSLADPSHTYLAAGTYEVKLVATSDLGCKDSLIDKLAAIIHPKPDADFLYSRIGSFDNETEVEFTEASVDGVGWTWWIDNLPVGSGPTYQHVFQDTGIFNVMLRVENSHGCNDSLTKGLFIVPEAALKVPTSFSPNDDNLNDVFKPLGVRFVKEYKLSIYDRWGGVIFTSLDPNIGWDGTFKGAKVLSGQYVVLVEVIDFNNEKTKYNGTITVLR
ncbi:MAG: PKD domain-containing protein [Bacteroidia bacterium]|nr:PKD domain-containing protein [Bacteroidia bacterium]